MTQPEHHHDHHPSNEHHAHHEHHPSHDPNIHHAHHPSVEHRAASFVHHEKHPSHQPETITITPHADTVGSYLRPESIIKARKQFDDGKLPKHDLTSIEDEEIKKLVEKQVASGLTIVSDGEFRQYDYCQAFWTDLRGVIGKRGITKLGWIPKDELKKDHHITKEEFGALGPSNLDGHPGQELMSVPFVTHKITLNPSHYVFKSFEYLKSIAPKGTIPKAILPSPNFLLFAPETQEDIIGVIYPNFDSFLFDVASVYKEVVMKLYDLGCRYIQIDEPTWMAFSYSRKATKEEQVKEMHRLIDLTTKVLEPTLRHHPEDLKWGLHHCKANGDTHFKVPFTYNDVVYGWKILQPDFLLLEYDDERSGDFSALKELHAASPKTEVFLGLVSTKKKEIEKTEYIESRLEEAFKVFPKELLGLCPQCGFNTYLNARNICDEKEQWEKIELIASESKKIFGNA